MNNKLMLFCINFNELPSILSHEILVILYWIKLLTVIWEVKMSIEQRQCQNNPDVFWVTFAVNRLASFDLMCREILSRQLFFKNESFGVQPRWRLSINNSEPSLKCLLLNNGNKFACIPSGHSLVLKNTI